jgi:hypothetical protein
MSNNQHRYGDVDPECVIKLASHMSRLRTNVLEFHIYPPKLRKADALKMSRERERERESSQLTSRFVRLLHSRCLERERERERESEREFTTDLKICTLTASNLFTQLAYQSST